jgi:hypothetical protein
MKTIVSIALAYLSGFGFWLVSRGLDAENPSLNGIIYGGIYAVVAVLYEILEEVKKKKQ